MIKADVLADLQYLYSKIVPVHSIGSKYRKTKNIIYEESDMIEQYVNIVDAFEADMLDDYYTIVN